MTWCSYGSGLVLASILVPKGAISSVALTRYGPFDVPLYATWPGYK